MKKRLIALFVVIATLALVLAACTGNVTVTFDYNYQGAPKKVVKFDDNFVVPQDPTREGYIFEGWFMDKNGELRWTQPETLEKSITVYAKWTVDPNYNGGGDTIDLAAVFAQYDDYSKWNFQVEYYINGYMEGTDIIQYKGRDMAMQHDESTLTDYRMWDSAAGKYKFYVQATSGSYHSFYEDDPAYHYYDEVDYVELTGLSKFAFTKNGEKFSAVNVAATGAEVLFGQEGETFNTFDIYVENNKIAKIEATSTVETSWQTYNFTYKLTFSKYGQISFSAPKVDDNNGGNDDGPVTTNTSMFLDQNLSVESGCLEYTANVEALAYENSNLCRGVQFSKKSNITLTSKTSVSGVTKIEVYASTNVSGGVTVSAYVGSTELTADSYTLTGNNKTLTFTSSKGLSGAVKVVITGGSSKSVYVSGIAVTGTGVGGAASDTVTINKSSITLEIDGTDILVATAQSGGTITWTSSDSNVATVDQNGNVRAISAGTATITATCGSGSASCLVKVVAVLEFLGFDVATPSGVQNSVLQQAMLDANAGMGLPGIGTYDVLVIPVEFTDAPYDEQMLADLNLAFNDTTGATGWESVKSFYQKSSGGKLNLNFQIVGVNFGYKGQIYNAGSSKNYTQSGDEWKIIENALSWLDLQGVDFSKFDSNNDGCLDSVYFIYSRDFDQGQNADLWWAYCWNYYDNYSVDGKDPYYYFWASQGFMYYDDFSDVPAIPVNAETFIHETGHLLGLDDYYDYDDDLGGNKGLGGAAMMDWNFGDHDPYSKIMLGWITPKVVSTNTTTTIDLSDSNTQNDVVLIRLDSKSGYLCEYLLVDIYTNTGLNAWRANTKISGQYVLYGGAAYGARVFHISSAADQHCYDSEGYYYSFTNDNNSITTNSLIRLVEADGGNSVFNGSLAQASDLWQTGNTLSSLSSYYTSKNVTVRFTSVTATGATITVTYN